MLKNSMRERHEKIRHSLPYRSNGTTTSTTAAMPQAEEGTIRYTAIGISTGGPDALKKLLADIPTEMKGTILIAIHMPPDSTELLAQNLSRSTKHNVLEAQDGQLVEPGTVLLGPGGKQMSLSKSADGKVRVSIQASEEQELCRPSANILFKSLAVMEPRSTAAVIMTGMGEDGYLGMQELAGKGAYLMAQAPNDCLIYGMPRKPIEAGIISDVLTVRGLAERITTIMR